MPLLAALLLAGCVAPPAAPETVRRAGPPGELARAWYGLANRWVRYAPPSGLREPEAFRGMNCAVHRGEGAGERDVRGAAHLATVYAVLATTGPYDESLSGVPREDLGPAAIRLIRWMGLTYDRWRGRWQSAMWAAFGGQAAWFLWDDLDRETRALVRRMVTGEADRFLGKTPPARLDRDTKAEENAWNSLSLVMAGRLFPLDPRAPWWDRKAREFMLSAYLRPADLASGRRVDGVRLSRFSGANVRDDFSVENHGFFHPDYLACITINMTNCVPYRLAGRRIPASGTYNVAPIVGLTARLSTPDGGSFYPSGQDWERLRRVMYGKLYAQASVVLGDGDAAALERRCLRAAQRLQGRFTTGQFYADGERRYMLAEELAAANSTWIYLLHALVGEGAPPTPAPQLEARLRGPVVLPDGRLAFNRTARAFASFSWGSRETAGWTPLEPDIEVPPYRDAFLGRVRTMKHTGTVKIADRARAHAMGRDLAVIASIWRTNARRIRQDVAFAALRDGRLVYLERLVARKPHTVADVSTAVVYPPVRRAGYTGGAALRALPEGAWQPFTGEGPGIAANHIARGTRFDTGDVMSLCAVGLEWDRDDRAVTARVLTVHRTASPDAVAVRLDDRLVVVNFGDDSVTVDAPALPGAPRRVALLPFSVFLWPHGDRTVDGVAYARVPVDPRRRSPNSERRTQR